MLKVKILVKGKFALSKKSEVILVASSVIGTAALMYLLPERCCCGMSQQGQIASDNPQNTGQEADIDPETDDEYDDYHQITAQDCGITSNMTFSQAFAHARAELGRGSVFAWHGKLYNTFYKEEWLEMSLEDRQAFMNSIDFSYVPADDLPVEIRRELDNDLNNNDLDNNHSNHNDSHDGDSHSDNSHDDDSHDDDSHDDNLHDDSHNEHSHDNDSHDDDSNHQTIGGDTEGSDEHLIHLPEDPTGLFESHTPPEDEPVKPEDLTHLSDNPDFNNDSNTGGMEYFY